MGAAKHGQSQPLPHPVLVSHMHPYCHKTSLAGVGGGVCVLSERQ